MVSINLLGALPPLEFHYGIALARCCDMKFDFKWCLIRSGRATDTILNHPNMLSHMEGTICDIKYFFYKGLIALSVFFKKRKIQCFVNILKQLSSPNKCINFINNFLNKNDQRQCKRKKQKDNNYVIPRDSDVHEN